MLIAGLDVAQTGIKTAERHINNLRYADDTTFMAESEELKSLLMKVKEYKGNACCGFVIDSFYYVEVCSFYSCFLERFDHKWMLNFVKGFFCIY